MRRSAAGTRAERTRSARIGVADRDVWPSNRTSNWALTATALAALGLALLLMPIAAKADPGAAEAPPAAMMSGADPVPPSSPSPRSLETLLVVPHHHDHRSDAEIADAEIAAAVERGTNPDLTKKSAFRKRNLDLFRTEREVEIGEQEMLLRLRLRAKSRETMSVELRF